LIAACLPGGYWKTVPMSPDWEEELISRYANGKLTFAECVYWTRRYAELLSQGVPEEWAAAFFDRPV